MLKRFWLLSNVSNKPTGAAIPLTILYEMAIIGIWFTERRRARETETASPES